MGFGFALGFGCKGFGSSSFEEQGFGWVLGLPWVLAPGFWESLRLRGGFDPSSLFSDKQTFSCLRTLNIEASHEEKIKLEITLLVQNWLEGFWSCPRRLLYSRNCDF